MIENIICGITHPDYFLSNISEFTKELYYAFYSQQQLLEILFSGMQSAVLPVRIEEKIREFISKTNVHLDESRDILLTYLIQGSYHLYRKHCHKFDVEKLIHLVTVASEAALNAVEEMQ